MNKQTQSTLFSSERQNWETPRNFFNELDKKYNFMYDLAASKENSKCPLYFTEEENSLKQDWYKLCSDSLKWLWINPPYGRGITEQWVKKCDEEAQKGANIIALLPARTDTNFFHKYIYKKYDFNLLKGRLKFELGGEPILDKDGKPSAAPFPSMIVYFTKR